MAKQIIVSHEGLKKLQQELEHLKTVKRKEVAQAIQKEKNLLKNNSINHPVTEPTKNKKAYLIIKAIFHHKNLKF